MKPQQGCFHSAATAMSNTNRRIGSTVFSFAAVLICLIVVGSIFTGISFTLIAFKEKAVKTPIIQARQRFHWSSLFSVSEEIEEGNNNEVPDTLLPPIDLRPEERKAWFNQTIPEFGIFKSTASTRRFEGRACKFFNGGCEAQFFMTWIAPVKSFREREFVAIESLFKSHPNGCLMILSRSMDSKDGREVLKPLTESGFKVTALTPDFDFLLKSTPADAWLDDVKKGNRDPGEIPLAQNLSNLLRLAVLYKYGGIYMDTDFIVLKKVSHLRNTLGAQSMDFKSGNWTRLNNAFLIFDKEHPILFKFLEGFSLNFDGNKWGHNGPYLLSRVVESIGLEPGYNITVLPPAAFYPVDWIKINEFFHKPWSTEESQRKEANLKELNRGTYSVHLWNKHTSKFKIQEGSIMAQLISDHCVLCQHTHGI